MTEHHATLAVAGALIVTSVSIVLSQMWRQLKRRFANFTWAPHVTPGIRAEAIMVMGEGGYVGVEFEKIRPEDNISEIFAEMTSQWFVAGESMGVSLNWSAKIGAVIDTPDGPEYVVALVRPTTKKPNVRPLSKDEASIEALADDPVVTGETS